jgi:hypothetical protein
MVPSMHLRLFWLALPLCHSLKDLHSALLSLVRISYARLCTFCGDYQAQQGSAGLTCGMNPFVSLTT